MCRRMTANDKLALITESNNSKKPNICNADINDSDTVHHVHVYMYAHMHSSQSAQKMSTRYRKPFTDNFFYTSLIDSIMHIIINLLMLKIKNIFNLYR